ncbi:hypothetical protein Agub_g10781 [Astrephomene gubernaculifera]|uniref:Uncharacterized protein n=1 Tax=Astrephomene gubernaculifera TaxID=47775 RepID=A0AAD3HPZ4_9CHLO|nr:hypothetical protein Agub_g10781 [Astrephomene gubernaculifera]
MSQAPDAATPVIVGLAFLPKKLPRVLTPQLRVLAESKGLRLVALDPHVPLEEQEPGGQRAKGALLAPGEPRDGRREAFDVIVHKLHADPVWEAHLARYIAAHPHVRQLDPPAAIHATEDRAVMLAGIPPGGLQLKLRLPQPQPQPLAQPQPPPHSVPSPQQSPGPQSAVLQSLHARPRVLPGPESGLGGTRMQGPRLEAEVAVTVLAPAQLVVASRKELRRLAGSAGAGAAAGTLAPRASPLQPPLLLKTQRSDAGGTAEGTATTAAATAPTAAPTAATAPTAAAAAAAAGCGGPAPAVPACHRLAVAACWSELEALGQELQLQRPAQGSAGGEGGKEGGGGDGIGAGSTAGGGEGDESWEEGGSWTPLVVQQYVPHTEELYKVYVLGRHVRVERRASLTLAQLRALGGGAAREGEQAAAAAGKGDRRAGGLLVHNLSAQPQATGAIRAPAASAGDSDDAGPAIAAEMVSGALDERILHAVAHALSQRLGLSMFNFDAVVPVPEHHEQQRHEEQKQDVNAASQKQQQQQEQQQRLSLFVVDVNYFPGYDKLSGWEEMLVDHLRAAADEAVAARGLSLPGV